MKTRVTTLDAECNDIQHNGIHPYNTAAECYNVFMAYSECHNGARYTDSRNSECRPMFVES
jgi:hypothetical protein